MFRQRNFTQNVQVLLVFFRLLYPYQCLSYYYHYLHWHRAVKTRHMDNTLYGFPKTKFSSKQTLDVSLAWSWSLPKSGHFSLIVLSISWYETNFWKFHLLPKKLIIYKFNQLWFLVCFQSLQFSILPSKGMYSINLTSTGWNTKNKMNVIILYVHN
jgi:hypothetical protein